MDKIFQHLGGTPAPLGSTPDRKALAPHTMEMDPSDGKMVCWTVFIRTQWTQSKRRQGLYGFVIILTKPRQPWNRRVSKSRQ
eukprot:9441329-Karenia_brevis.AAC.1